MAIEYYEKEKVFKLDTKNSSYIMAIIDEEQFLGHVYYGNKIIDKNMNYLLRTDESPFVPSKNNRDRVSFYDSFPFEYPTYGVGDYRDACLQIKSLEGHSAVSLTYDSHEIFKGKKELAGMPSTYGNEEECTTLEIACIDKVLSIKVILSYTVFEEYDVITRSVKIHNTSKEAVILEKVLSACLELDGMDYDMITLHGSWARERHIQRRGIAYGKQSASSIRGESSHQDNPFLAVLERKASEDYGEVYGLNFVYSGNFIAQVEGCQFDTIRATMGINPTNFTWILDANEQFQAPEVVMVYSNEGIGAMTRSFHDLYRNNLIRGKYKNKKRPILINNWEATYFDFNTEKLLDIAKKASELGIELFVLDDGWFGKRNSDNESLGDWVVNEEKIAGGLENLVSQINKLGMKFGLWFEPEMVSPNSDLYRKHPDWAIQIPGRSPSLCRNQYVLDFSRKDVRDYIFESISKIIDSANIEYIKWDMNRQLTDLGSYGLDANRQGELSHRYVLGVYDMMDRFTKRYPDILLENCSGGGARFDPAMLYYSPQIWCSDDTDAIERLKIQTGTAMVYPLSSIGAHVSVCPNHTVGRRTPFETRGYVALAGTFGYELDLTKLSIEESNKVKEQVALYHKYNDLICQGDYYRISPQEDNGYVCWQIVAKDKKETLIIYTEILKRPNVHSRRIRLKGLAEQEIYLDSKTKVSYSGGALMYGGLLVNDIKKDFAGKLYHFTKK